MTKQLDTALIQRILNLPQAPLLVEALKSALEKEQKQRLDFYNLLTTEENKAEFINGEVIIQSPIKKEHNLFSGLLYQLLNIYVSKKDLGFVGIEKIMISLTRNDYEPDLCFFRKEKSNSFLPDQSLFPAPDLAIEFTSPKTESRDRGIKFEDYQQHAVEEYWIISTDQKVVEQYRLEEDTYRLVIKSGSGELESSVVQGFKIPIKAIFDPVLNMQVLTEFLSKA